MDTINSLGFIEVYGLVPGIEAADAMLKSAQVRLLRQYEVHPGLITVTVEGDLAACQAAVNAGVAAASRIGKVVSSLVIPRPDGDTETMVLELITKAEGGGSAEETKPGLKGAAKAGPVKPKTAMTPSVTEAKPASKPRKAASAKNDAAKASGQGGKAADTSGEVKEALEFIFKVAKGRSWTDIAKKFPNQSQRLRKELDALVKSGGLDKVGARYRKPAPKE